MNSRDEFGLEPKAEAEDAAINSAWRDASAEQPPAALDAAILAASRASGATTRDTNVADIAQARSAPAKARARSDRVFMRWQPLVAAASVAGLAFLVVQMLPRDPRPSPSLTHMSEEVASSPSEAVPSPPLAESAAPAETTADATNTATNEPQRDVGILPMPTTAPVPAPDSTPAAAAASAASPAGAPEPMPPPHEESMSAERGLSATAASPAMAKQSMDAQLRPDADAWASRIAALHAGGDLEGAATSLRDFRAAYEKADDYLPPALQAWARTVE
jgi:cytoskeletal protein RodZ